MDGPTKVPVVSIDWWCDDIHHYFRAEWDTAKVSSDLVYHLLANAVQRAGGTKLWVDRIITNPSYCVLQVSFEEDQAPF